MRYYSSILIIVVMISIWGCSRNCENVEVGSITFSEETMKYLVHEDNTTVTFQNAEGQKIQMTTTVREGEYHVCTKITCSPVDPYKSDFCEYIKTPVIEVFLQNDSTLLGLTLSAGQYEPESDKIYESAKLAISHINDSASAYKVTHVRFDDPQLEKENLPFNSYVSEGNTINIEGKVHNDVLLCDDGNLKVYYSLESGFVAFEVNGVLWKYV